MTPTKKLYRVTLRAWKGTDHCPMKENFVVAENSHAAYQYVREWYEQRKWGTAKDRELESVTLIADQREYPDCEARLFLQEERTEAHSSAPTPGDRRREP